MLKLALPETSPKGKPKSKFIDPAKEGMRIFGAGGLNSTLMTLEGRSPRDSEKSTSKAGSHSSDHSTLYET